MGMDTTNCLPLDLRPLNLPPSSSSSSKKKRTKLLLRPDPPYPKPNPHITIPCPECGKTFWSPKALFGHMRCHPERQWRGIKPPPNFRPPPITPPLVTEEDHEVAACLLILANQGTLSGTSCRFECSSCKKVFGSHQALGGHRASHKNVKGCYANTKKEDEEEEGWCIGGGEGHKCSVCYRVFSTGQALGGHKRCHWDKMEIASSTLSAFHLDFNLNFPAPQNHHHSTSFSSGLPDLDLRLGL